MLNMTENLVAFWKKVHLVDCRTFGCMSIHLDYTARARQLWTRYPVLTHVSIQVNFWIIVNVLLGVIMHLHTLRLHQIASFPVQSQFRYILFVAVILGLVYGLVVGYSGYFLEKYVYHKKSLGAIIFLNTVVGLLVLALLLTFIRLFLTDFVMRSYSPAATLNSGAWLK